MTLFFAGLRCYSEGQKLCSGVIQHQLDYRLVSLRTEAYCELYAPKRKNKASLNIAPSKKRHNNTSQSPRPPPPPVSPAAPYVSVRRFEEIGIRQERRTAKVDISQVLPNIKRC